MKRPLRSQEVASLALNDGDDLSSFSSASTYCSPRRRRKHQRTMEAAFRSFTIGKEKQMLPIRDDTASSNIDMAMNDDTMQQVQDDESACSSLEDELLLTDQERAERKVMFELVFGKNHESLVEAKLQEWIQRTATESTESTHRQQGVCQDDMNLPPAGNSNNGLIRETMDNDLLANDNNRTCFRQRSNSLPTDLYVVSPGAGMLVEEIGDNDGMELSLQMISTGGESAARLQTLAELKQVPFQLESWRDNFEVNKHQELFVIRDFVDANILPSTERGEDALRASFLKTQTN